MFDKIVIITKKTPLEELIERFNTLSQAKFYIEHSGQSFAEYEAYHDSYRTAVKRLQCALPAEMKSQFIERGFLTNFLFGEKDLIITLGPDGLVVNTAKYLNGQPVMAVNPDRSRIDGVLLPFWIDYIENGLSRVLEKEPEYENISMAKVTLDNGQTLYAVNDFFIGPKSHTCLQYTLTHKKRSERQMSSGIIVSTGAGSTGWFKAVMAGSQSIYLEFKNEIEKRFSAIEEKTFKATPVNKTSELKTQVAYTGARPDPYPEELKNASPAKLSNLTRFDRESEELVFMVREPFESKISKNDITYGRIMPGDKFTIVSHTPSNGVIFSDGIESDYLEFNSGRTAHIETAEKKVKLIK